VSIHTTIHKSLRSLRKFSDTPVAQIFNLLYRRFSTCEARDNRARKAVPEFCRLQFGDTAECNSALLCLRLRRAVFVGRRIGKQKRLGLVSARR
jgi:hypothetical protein